MISELYSALWLADLRSSLAGLCAPCSAAQQPASCSGRWLARLSPWFLGVIPLLALGLPVTMADGSGSDALQPAVTKAVFAYAERAMGGKDASHDW